MNTNVVNEVVGRFSEYFYVFAAMVIFFHSSIKKQHDHIISWCILEKITANGSYWL